MKHRNTVLSISALLIGSALTSSAGVLIEFSDAGGGQTRLVTTGSVNLGAPTFGPTNSGGGSADDITISGTGNGRSNVLIRSFARNSGDDRWAWEGIATVVGSVGDVFPDGVAASDSSVGLSLGSTTDGYTLSVEDGNLVLWVNDGVAAPTSWSPGENDVLLDIDFSNFGTPGASYSIFTNGLSDNEMIVRLAAVPEASDMSLLALGLTGLLGFRRRARSRRS